MKRTKVLIALSGGVDSSVSAILLKQRGFDLVGVTFNVCEANDYRIYPIQKGINDAAILAECLQIPYFVIDVKKDFRNTVVADFIDSYKNGITPNPCALCNYNIKWAKLIEIADEFGCDYVATGHYAIVNQCNERYFISVPNDLGKDQSYFLWRLSQEQLKRTLFPLGELKKETVKHIALENGFKGIAGKRESYNICFIPDGDYRTFINSELSNDEKNSYMAAFVNKNGQEFNEHSEIWNYTIGQRKEFKGINSVSKYVISLDTTNRKITLGEKSDLYMNTSVIEPFNLSKYTNIPSNLKLKAKYSYRGNLENCTVETKENQLVIKFEMPVYAMSAGQSIVLYQDNDLVGGGVIKEAYCS